jgi:Cd2+/Zn2+-exporting ATPase
VAVTLSLFMALPPAWAQEAGAIKALNIVIIEGEGAIDEAPVTGESVPVRKGPGAPVFAGTINTDAVLRIRVLAAAADNTIARVIRLVEEAQESKAPTERFIDRFSRYYTPAVVAMAALVAMVPPLAFGGAWGAWVYRALALLLIGCPCALVISTPAAIAAALSAGARRGLLMKGGAVLETLGKVTDMALDKTGTLTEGKPKVTDIVTFGRTEDQVLAMAASLEVGSNHPLAMAILAHAKAKNVMVLPAKDARADAGKGVVGRFGGSDLFLGSAGAAGERVTLGADVATRIAALHDQGKTVAVLLAGNQLAGLIAMRDEPRADAVAGVQVLKQAGITPVMLTGDNRRTAEAVGNGLGIAVHAELLPEDKQRIVREMQARNRIVGKVGDGINDAPALAAAHVGIAMGGGTDVALETADAAVLHGRMVDIGHMVMLARAAMANIHQNIAIALGLKAVFLVTTLVGVTGLWPAILADTGATVLVTANAMRLLAWRTQ